MALREGFTHTEGLFSDLMQGPYLTLFFVFSVFFVVKKYSTAPPAGDWWEWRRLAADTAPMGPARADETALEAPRDEPR